MFRIIPFLFLFISVNLNSQLTRESYPCREISDYPDNSHNIRYENYEKGKRIYLIQQKKMRIKVTIRYAELPQNIYWYKIVLIDNKSQNLIYSLEDDLGNKSTFVINLLEKTVLDSHGGIPHCLKYYGEGLKIKISN